MRGYVFQNTAERYPLWLATLANGALFGMPHLNQVDSALAGGLLIASATAVSTFLILCRLITGSLWMAIGWHAAWNWAVGMLLGLGDGPAQVRSERLAPAYLIGTAQMPEVGLAFILVEGVGILLLLVAARRKGRIPDWRARLTSTGDLPI